MPRTPSARRVRVALATIAVTLACSAPARAAEVDDAARDRNVPYGTGYLIGAGLSFGAGVGLQLLDAYVLADSCVNKMAADPTLAGDTAIADCTRDTGSLAALRAGAAASMVTAVSLAGVGGWRRGVDQGGALAPAVVQRRSSATLGLGITASSLGVLTLTSAILTIPAGWSGCDSAECFNGRVRARVLAISAASALSAVGVSLITYSVALRKTAAKRRLELRVAPSFSARGAGLSLTGRFG